MEELYYLCSEIKGAGSSQLIRSFGFASAKSLFSHDAAHFIVDETVTL